jgi:para-nitrobenzyl esterase
MHPAIPALTACALLAACGSSFSSGANPAADGGDASADAGACPTSVAPAPGVVLTDRGPVQGTQEKGVWSYRGIPYAAPPLGALRWAAPQEHACWSSALAATSFGAMCLQVDPSAPTQVLGQEDCLTVNVWAPASATTTSQLPVLAFIHGGGNVQGSSADTSNGAPIYDGAALAAEENAVVVTFNYRLGAMGFLAHPSFGAHAGNYGTLDQTFALGWVQRNAAAFGGDPAHVLLFGQSAGAVDVCAQVASPMARGLFAAALMESGGCVAKTAAQAQAFAQKFAQTVHCDTASDPAACLRALSADAVTLAIPEPASVYAGKQGDYQPNVDGAFLLGLPHDDVAAGMHNHVPLVIGSNSDETSLELAKAHPAGITAAEYPAAVLQYAAGNQALASAVVAQYPASSYATPLEAFIQATTDAKFTCTARYDARAAAAGQTDRPLYRYFFTHHLDSGSVIERALGAWHGLELAFVFVDLGSGGPYVPSPAEQGLAATIGGSWTRLAAAGDPSGPLTWPAYDATTDAYLQLDEMAQAGTGVRTAQCDFWDRALGR